MTIIVKKNQSLTDIKNILEGNSVEGYVWFSDKSEPYLNENINNSFDTMADPRFIVEAHFIVENISHSIRFVDGGHLVAKFNLDEIKKEKCEIKKYLSHRIKDHSKIYFYELWLPEKDAMCCDMEVLKFNGLVFAGFGNDSNNTQSSLL